jgi:hypothetical protein
MLVTEDNDLSATLYRMAIFAASGGGTPCACLRKDDLAHAISVSDCVTDVGQDTGHLRFFGSEDALAGEKHFEEGRPNKCGPNEPAEYGQKQDQRRDEGAEVMQEVSCPAEPAKEGHDGEAIDSGEARTMLSCAMRRVSVSQMAYVDAANVQVGETSGN